MILYDYFLKFDDEEASDIFLDPILTELRINIDYCILKGIYISKTTGIVLKYEEGLEYEETIPIEGYHVNIRSISLLEIDSKFFASAESYQNVFSGKANYINNKEKI
ncbi:hypothetical protein [Acinetobacter seifertii]|uniref:hypothetical protein n=1 Tax=Acinetobacter seifertii TaxID=1530123 RepID=UPI00386299AA